MKCCASIDAKTHTFNQQSLPPSQHKMNKNCTAVRANFSYLRSTVLAYTRYRKRVSKEISPSFTSRHSSHIFFIVVFACACLPFSAVSAAYSDHFPEPYYNTYDSTNKSMNKPCSDCGKINLEMLMNITLEGIKTKILSRLGLREGAIPKAGHLNKSMLPPSADFGFPEDPQDPKVIRHANSHKQGQGHWQSDEARFDDGYLDDGVKTRKIAVKAKKGESVIMGIGFPRKPLQFTFDSLMTKCNVTNARLFLYQKASPRDLHIHSRKVLLSVQKMNNPTNNSRSYTVTTVNETVVLNENASWIHFDFGPTRTQEFFNDRGDSLPITVRLWIHPRYADQNTSGDVPLVIDWPKCENKNEFECTNVPYLQLEIEEIKSRRSKRSTDRDCPKDKDKVECCRYPLTVDFDKFGWDFIIAPRSYDAHYCAGECTYLNQQKFGHTHVTMMTAESSRTPAVRPCCGPRSMSSITMLYFNENNNIVFGVLPSMVVERCGCQ